MSRVVQDDSQSSTGLSRLVPENDVYDDYDVPPSSVSSDNMDNKDIISIDFSSFFQYCKEAMDYSDHSGTSFVRWDSSSHYHCHLVDRELAPAHVPLCSPSV